MWEATHNYGLHLLDLEPGSIVMDIGAHVGVVAIYLAKKYDEITVHCYEPDPVNFTRLERNIIANGVEDSIIAINKAISFDGRMLNLRGDYSGQMSALGDGHRSVTVESITLSDALQDIDRLAVLKIDCEGMEYEILENSLELMGRVDRLIGEFHFARGHSPSELIELCEQHVDFVNVMKGSLLNES